MKKIHPLSFALGTLSGVLVVVIIFGGARALMRSSRSMRGGFGNGQPNIARMAERMGMTEAEIQKELDSGKTMPQIMEEHGMQMGGRRMGSSSSSGSGATMGSSSSASSVLSSSSSSK